MFRSPAFRSLFVSGFFADSLNRSLVDVDYYILLGARAYGSLAQRDDTFGDVFDELAGNIPAFVGVLCEVSERSALTSNTDVLRLYENGCAPTAAAAAICSPRAE